MKLSAGMLSDCLLERFEPVCEVIRSEERLYDQVILWCEDTQFRQGKAYIGLGSGLPGKPFFDGHSAIISIGPAEKRYQKFDCDYFELPESASVPGVHNCIQAAFEKYQSWHESVLGMALAGKGLQEIVEASLPLFENPIYLHDSNYRFLASAEGRGLPGPADVYGIQENSGWLSRQELCLLRSTPSFEKTFETTKAAYHVDNGDYNIIYNNIRAGGRLRGRIFVAERVRPIKRGDYALLDELTHLIETTCFDRYYIYSGRVRALEKQMIKLLEGEPADLNALYAGIGELDLGEPDHYCCFQIQMQKLDITMNTVIITCEHIEDELKNCYTFPYKNSIVGIVFIRPDEQEYYSAVARILPVLERFSLHAGVSLPFRNILSFPKYHEQTSSALKYGRSGKSGRWLHYFEEYSFTYMMDCCIEKMPPEMLCPPAFLRLVRYDKENQTDFAATLRAYLENSSSPAKAIKALFIHRSTFMYRMERIREILGVDPDDKQTRLHLLMAFQMFDRYSEAYHENPLG
ncbi:MAG: helix-turn-helix domain-containing protein [Clostridiales bacterium]|nr:helix-turn-helix domain-containing protein [Clostridiales bacterium]